MNVSIIGSGNVAYVLARLCVQSGHTIQKIISRNTETGKQLANLVGAGYVNIKEFTSNDSDLVIAAVSDNSLPDALAGLNFKDVPIVHTAGSVSIHVLKNTGTNYGVLYPLQSLRKEMEIIPPIPFLIEANNEPTFQFIEQFALTLSDNVKEEGEENRLRLHAAAVIVNNFTNYLYKVAEEFCNNECIDFNLLKPLIKETADRIQDHSPSTLQTGPGARKDIVTLNKHLHLLNAYPKLRTMYLRMTEGIMNG